MIEVSGRRGREKGEIDELRFKIIGQFFLWCLFGGT